MSTVAYFHVNLFSINLLLLEAVFNRGLFVDYGQQLLAARNKTICEIIYQQNSLIKK